jgi:hypothetical protein
MWREEGRTGPEIILASAGIAYDPMPAQAHLRTHAQRQSPMSPSMGTAR